MTRNTQHDAQGLGSREDIDTTLKLGCNMPMGPLTLADFIGLDTVLAIMYSTSCAMSCVSCGVCGDFV